MSSIQTKLDQLVLGHKLANDIIRHQIEQSPKASNPTPLDETAQPDRPTVANPMLYREIDALPSVE